MATFTNGIIQPIATGTSSITPNKLTFDNAILSAFVATDPWFGCQQNNIVEGAVEAGWQYWGSA